MLEIRASIVVSIPACHAGDRSSILRLGVFLYIRRLLNLKIKYEYIFIEIIKTIYNKSNEIVTINIKGNIIYNRLKKTIKYNYNIYENFFKTNK